MTMVIEDRDLDFDITLHPAMYERRRKDVARLCDLALAPGFQDNKCRLIRNEHWYRGIQKVATALQATDKANAEYNKKVDSLAEASCNFEMHVNARSDAYLGIDAVSSPIEFRRRGAAVSKAMVMLEMANEACNAARNVKIKREIEEARLIAASLDAARTALQRRGLLLCPLDVGPHAEDKRASDAADLEFDTENYSGKSTSRCNVYGSVTTVPEEPSVEFQARLTLRNARQERSRASRAFHRVRDEYSEDLVRFYEAKEKPREEDSDKDFVSQTRTMFDQRYYQKRAEANRQYTIAEDELEAAVAQAKEVGVGLTSGSIGHVWMTGRNGAVLRSGRLISVRSQDDGRVESDEEEENGGSDFVLDPHIARDQRGQIETWRQDPGQEETVSERHWEGMVISQEEDESLESLGSLSGYSMISAESEDRKAIDKWRDHCEELRDRGFPGLE